MVKKSKRTRSGLSAGTPAAAQLLQANIDFRIERYEHHDAASSYGLEAAAALGVDEASICKTLLVELSDAELVVCVIPVNARLDLRATARAAGSKKAQMADPIRAERITGYVLGGISPFGQRAALRTFIDASVEGLSEVYVSGGRRGLEVVVHPSAFGLALKASFHELQAAV